MLTTLKAINDNTLRNISFVSFQKKKENMGVIATIITGAFAGWLGGNIYKGSGLGLIGNIIIGILGAVVGGYLLGAIGINFGSGWFGSIINGAIGAIAILFLLNLVVKGKE